MFFQSILLKDQRFQKAYQAERQIIGGEEFSKALSSQNKIDVLYTNFSNINITGIAPETSPDDKTVLTDKKYENTEDKNQKELQQILKELKKIGNNESKYNNGMFFLAVFF